MLTFASEITLRTGGNSRFGTDVMNAKRRKELEKLVERIQGIIADLEVLRDEEQECFDNLPENLQESERGEKMEDNVSNMDAVIDSLESASDELDDAISESY